MRPILACVLGSVVFVPARAADPEVAVYRPEERALVHHAELPASLHASSTIALAARVDGAVEKILFREGAEVAQGQILFQLDARPIEIEVKAARSKLNEAEFRFKSEDARWTIAARNAQKNAIASEELKVYQIHREIARAGLEVARAELEAAHLKLEYTKIAAPCAGRIGRSAVSAGSVVKAYDLATPLATIRVLDPLHVHITLPADDLAALRQAVEKKVTIELRAPGEEAARQATLDFVGHHIDPRSGLLLARAVLPNPDGKLIAGQRVEVRVPLGPPRQQLLIAPQSILSDRAAVLVVNEQKLEERAVKLGAMIGELRCIETGLAPTDWVVAKPGKLKAGTEVKSRRLDAPPEGKKIEPQGGLPREARPPELPYLGPTIEINAIYKGATADVVRAALATPIEQQLNGLENVVSRVTTCGNDGSLRISLVLKQGTDLDQAMQLARNRLDLAQPRLPEQVQRDGMTIRKRGKFLLAAAVSMKDDRLDRHELARLAKDVRENLERVPGVSAVGVHGEAAPGPQLRVNFDRRRLQAFGLTVAEVAQALGAEAKASGSALVLPRTDKPDELGDTVVKMANGVAIRLKDVATIQLVTGWQTLTDVDGRPSMILLVEELPGARDTVKGVAGALDKLKKDLPAGIDVRVLP
ncbi:MAG: efflux RND transporter periplasmic adaptor subunit [Gemmataceae bacterium]